MTRNLVSISGEAQQTRKEVEASSQTLLSRVTGVGRQVIEKIAFLTQTTLEIKQSISNVASTVISLSLELSSFRLLLMSFRRGPVDEYYFTVEDALGRVFPVHLNTITSWDAFAFVLSEKFRGAPGARRVRDKRYRLIEYATRREVDQTKHWAKAFRPHEKIVMSLLCKESEQAPASTGELATCPWCKTESDSDTSTQVQCRNCNMFFTRIVELEDVALPPQPSSSIRQAPRFGLPSFNVQLPPDWTRKQKRKRPKHDNDTKASSKRFKSGASSKKRSRDDGEDVEMESDDEDIDGLVRVTMVSRRKRIKVFQVPSSTQTGSQPSLLGFATIQVSPSTPPGAKSPPPNQQFGASTPVPDFKPQRTGSLWSFRVEPKGYRHTLPVPEDGEDEENDNPYSQNRAARDPEVETEAGHDPGTRKDSSLTIHHFGYTLTSNKHPDCDEDDEEAGPVEISRSYPNLDDESSYDKCSPVSPAPDSGLDQDSRSIMQPQPTKRSNLWLNNKSHSVGDLMFLTCEP